jgi:hypothetical protein
MNASDLTDKASTNRITGIIGQDDLPEADEATRTLTVGPEDLQGHYAEIAELECQKDEKERIAKEEYDRLAGIQQTLAAKLSEIGGVPLPSADAISWYVKEGILTKGSNSTIEIKGPATIAALLAELEKLTK